MASSAEECAMRGAAAKIEAGMKPVMARLAEASGDHEDRQVFGEYPEAGKAHEAEAEGEGSPRALRRTAEAHRRRYCRWRLAATVTALMEPAAATVSPSRSTSSVGSRLAMAEYWNV